MVDSLYSVGTVLVGIGFGPVPRTLDLGHTRRDIIRGQDGTDDAPAFAVQRLKTGWHSEAISTVMDCVKTCLVQPGANAAVITVVIGADGIHLAQGLPETCQQRLCIGAGRGEKFHEPANAIHWFTPLRGGTVDGLQAPDSQASAF